ncbi:hypothetical protein [Paradevosia shaoguanensis]|uniref:hypothetical protein n=1 Tax=Paradevosia shaoguanensis TaxID=1335043 RepID=UPI0019336E31|nr:hypothetical protein [Paradevosia shaoguanensis]
MLPADFPPDDDEPDHDDPISIEVHTDYLLRRDRVEDLTNHQLVHAHRVLHNPSFDDKRWLPVIEAEMRKRGLIWPS